MIQGPTNSFLPDQEIEFTGPAWCRVLNPDPSLRPAMSQSFHVELGGHGMIVDRRDWATLPGDIPVEVFDEKNDTNIIISIREGLIAPIRIEVDPRSGRRMFKHYRNMTVELLNDDQDA